MYIIIAGGGIVGQKIAASLSMTHDVVVVDREAEVCEKIATKVGAIAILGDATSMSTLKEAGIEKADYVIGVMNQDSSNLLFALLAKNFNVQRIFVRMRDPEYKAAFEIAGATNIGHSVGMLVDKFVFEILNPKIRRIASIHEGKADVSLVTISEKSRIVGKSIKEFAHPDLFPEDVIIAGVYDVDRDELIIPRGSTIVHEGNQMFLIGKTDSVIKAYKSIK